MPDVALIPLAIAGALVFGIGAGRTWALLSGRNKNNGNKNDGNKT